MHKLSWQLWQKYHTWLFQAFIKASISDGSLFLLCIRIASAPENKNVHYRCSLYDIDQCSFIGILYLISIKPPTIFRGPLWSWSNGSWINYRGYLCNQYQSCEFEYSTCRGVLDTTLCDKVCQWLATGQRFSSGTHVF